MSAPYDYIIIGAGTAGTTGAPLATVTAITTIATIRPAFRDVFFAAETDHTITALAGPHVNDGFVDEFHGCLINKLQIFHRRDAECAE